MIPKESINDFTSTIEVKDNSTCPTTYIGSRAPSYTGVFFVSDLQAQRVAQAMINGQESGVSTTKQTKCFDAFGKLDEFTIKGGKYSVLVGFSDVNIPLARTSRLTAQGGGGAISIVIVPTSIYELDGLTIQRGLVLDWRQGKVIDQRTGVTKLMALSAISFTLEASNASSIEALLEQFVTINIPIMGWNKTPESAALYEVALMDENIEEGNYFSIGTVRPQGGVSSDVVKYVLVSK